MTGHPWMNQRRALLRATLGLGPGLMEAGALWLPLAGQAATPGIDAPPEPLPPRPVQVPPLQQAQLANGLSVISAPLPGLPLVSAMLLLRVGAEADAPGQPGVAAMTATLLAKGTRRGGRPVSATVLAQQAESLGSALDAASGWRSSSLAMTVTRPKLEAALALMADVMRQPLLAADELERARAQALDGLRVSFKDPAALSGLLLRRAWWGESPYGAVAAPAALQKLTVAALRDFHARWYRPEQAALVLAGDITADEAQALAQRLLGDWRGAAPALAPPAAASAPAPLAAPLVLLDMPGAGQSGVAVAAPFVASGDAQRRVAQVAGAVLGGGYSARLNQEVRIKRGLSYGAFADSESQPPGGMLAARTQTDHKTAAEALALLRGEITRLAAEPPTPAELAARQATLVGSFARRLDTTGGLAALAASQWSQGRPLADLQRTVPEILAVTSEQVAAFARSHWTPERLRAVVVGDLAAAGAGLAPAAEPRALRLTMATLDLMRPGLVAARPGSAAGGG
ncbi:M16 family metallopeptidase [Aquabacterium sp. OR-4]|uniref:M16 family metallopeptidase n=1 Tax=Aquabacterium sp. OR-4 TaxID=2978127 RepID=UPI0021B325E4|nr:pitrilysin family protein [Aquabacterium sp. OR-4]MDT7837848.1 pitrilysin family protein [Aquabacterium sp. OR-4]